MSYTLRQVQPLLTKPELELFQASRAGPIKAIPLARLASKIQRSRALRDKYRDVYRRQTLQTRSAAPKARKPLGGENTRTQTKAEIMDEVLKRFEAAQQKLQGAESKPTNATKPKAAASPRQAKAATAAAPARKPAAKAAPRKQQTPTEASVSAGIKRLQSIVKAVRKKVTESVAASIGTDAPAKRTRRAAKDSKAEALSAAPTDITPSAQRANPLKAEPVKQKIHASARSRTRAAQAKRDAR